ncbi:MAG: PhoH-like protein [Firmicutes bacterium ADurb.Bin467]|nr:MAG: PhoH-like protein [Firmicutes bacterium ADurb.Bin467]
MAREYSMARRVLVTGGAGFVGSHLIDRLIERGDEVLCVDNLFTGAKANIAHLLPHPRFEFLRHDICLPLFVEVDAIFNLACPASPIHYQHDPVQTTKVSVIGAINMLGLAKRTKVPILQASTSEVYGDPTQHPQTESYWGNVNPIGLRSCYDEGKRCAETLFFDYHRQHGIDVKVARIFNTYGPRMHPNDGRVVSNFVVQALQNKDVERIILTRPAVEAGEKLGFLPGDLAQKVDPYLRPLYDALNEMMGVDAYQRLVERGAVEVAPLAYMRGRTLNDAFIILDEAQNTTSEQMKMFLTRMGMGSKMVITGDVTQIDLPAGKKSGLVEALEVLKGVPDIGISMLTHRDVVRHELVQAIVRAYEKHVNRKGTVR